METSLLACGSIRFAKEALDLGGNTSQNVTSAQHQIATPEAIAAFAGAIFAEAVRSRDNELIDTLLTLGEQAVQDARAREEYNKKYSGGFR